MIDSFTTQSRSLCSIRAKEALSKEALWGHERVERRSAQFSFVACAPHLQDYFDDISRETVSQRRVDLMHVLNGRVRQKFEEANRGLSPSANQLNARLICGKGGLLRCSTPAKDVLQVHGPWCGGRPVPTDFAHATAHSGLFCREGAACDFPAWMVHATGLGLRDIQQQSMKPSSAGVPCRLNRDWRFSI